MKRKQIALIAHDKRKKDMVEWVRHNKTILSDCDIFCTGTTGRLVAEVFDNAELSCNVVRLKSGPLGGDQQIGAMICEGRIDFVVFLIDNLSMQPHDVDIKALTRLTQLYNIPAACNRSSADFIISSPLFVDESYEREKPQFDDYVNREV